MPQNDRKICHINKTTENRIKDDKMYHLWNRHALWKKKESNKKIMSSKEKNNNQWLQPCFAVGGFNLLWTHFEVFYCTVFPKNDPEQTKGWTKYHLTDTT